jgi:hypothetical protein
MIKMTKSVRTVRPKTHGTFRFLFACDGCGIIVKFSIARPFEAGLGGLGGWATIVRTHGT